MAASQYNLAAATSLAPPYVAIVANANTASSTAILAIIPNVFTEQECNDLLDKMWSFFEHITQNFEQPMDRNNPDSFKQLQMCFYQPHFNFKQ